MTPADRNYKNDRRSGKTNPDRIEILDRDDPRHPEYNRYAPNRAYRRRVGAYVRGRVCPPYAGPQLPRG